MPDFLLLWWIDSGELTDVPESPKRPWSLDMYPLDRSPMLHIIFSSFHMEPPRFGAGDHLAKLHDLPINRLRVQPPQITPNFMLLIKASAGATAGLIRRLEFSVFRDFRLC